MRKFLRMLAPFLLLCGFLISSTRCRAEIIRSFDVVVRLQNDASLDVTETITMDFGKTLRHGIYRQIPFIDVRQSSIRNLDVQFKSATDEKNMPRKFVQKRDTQELNIRIGDPQKLVRGAHIYRLRYIVKGAVYFYKNTSKLRWNVTSFRWPFRILKATARFYPPKNVKVSQIEMISFRRVKGPFQTVKNTVVKDSIFISASNLNIGEALFFFVELPKGSLQSTSQSEESQ